MIIPDGMSIEGRNGWFRKYEQHTWRCKNRLDAAKQPIEMKLTFIEWLTLWIDSGQWNNRGRKRGQYCMSRVDDLGHYELGNVFIQQCGYNSAEANKRQIGTKREDTTKMSEWQIGGIKSQDTCKRISNKQKAYQALNPQGPEPKIYSCDKCKSILMSARCFGRWHKDC